jgi:hypothetical protein
MGFWFDVGGTFTGDNHWACRDGVGCGVFSGPNAVITRGVLPPGVSVSRTGSQVGIQPGQTRTRAPHMAMAGNKGTR